jgi:Methyltransferase domain
MLIVEENHSQAFHDVNELLLKYRSVWSESAFVSNELSWRGTYAVMYEELLGLSDSELNVLSNEARLIARLSSHLPDLRPLTDWHVLPGPERKWPTPQRAQHGLPARKRRQTEGFVTALLPWIDELDGERDGKNVVDWCSGKGHLARQLHYACGSPVLCLERDRALCEAGKLAHDRMDPDMSCQVAFREQDVLVEVEPENFANAYLQTALHACGNLHMSMLRQAAQARTPLLACSPCCYHVLDEPVYQGLSEQGRLSSLKPTRKELQIVGLETCTANGIERELRQKELLWRVAFDLHLRELTGVDAYRPTPSVKKSLLKKNYRAFALNALKVLQKRGLFQARLSELSEPDELVLFRRAKAKLARIRRLEKAQLGFRRALEYWLLLDRVLFLQKEGYRVSLQEFCTKRDSGRNIMILAALGDQARGSKAPS